MPISTESGLRNHALPRPVPTRPVAIWVANRHEQTWRTAAVISLRISLISALSLALVFPAFARDLRTDADVATAINAECAAIYHASRPCACPDDPARNGSRCGGRSAYSRPAGASPRYYVKDVSAKEIADYRTGKRDFAADCAPLP